jgi:hypothetical protein
MVQHWRINMPIAKGDVSTLRVSKSKTKPILNGERNGRESDDDLIQRVFKELFEYRRRCG